MEWISLSKPPRLLHSFACWVAFTVTTDGFILFSPSTDRIWFQKLGMHGFFVFIAPTFLVLF
jgi:hypothetical protein